MAQYRTDRDPKEPLFVFRRCLAHFAMDTDLAFMTTQLRGAETRFLPFNQGDGRGAGNPSNPEGFKTAYLWERVWKRDSMLEVLNHFVQQVDVEDENGKKTGQQTLIFPRYHQLDAVRKLIGDARSHGAGRNYLIQHSAGSGKSNTIAWLCHQLAGLHGLDNERVFDTIIIITDRRVLDKQLRNTIRSFAQVRGVVATIENHKGAELAEALQKGRQIIVVTLQSFPSALEKIGELPGKRFAVVIDEAHSSQSGDTNAAVKGVLGVPAHRGAEQDEAPAPDDEDTLNANVEASQRKRGRLPNVSFFAFTATPKNKTLELFGTPQPDGSMVPFSLYSMRQAIEEGFILDVLRNYTTYKTYFSLVKRIEDDPQYDRKKGTYLLRSYVDLNEHAIARKTEIMVRHFHEQVRHRIDGQAKAMVVTRSRLAAVRYKQAFDKFLKERGHPYRALVAFSGEVTDPDTGETFTEARMNAFPESQTADTFKQTDCRFLIVAEKFQTGFDQPLLHTMYVDKKLDGVHAVQTLSRLNRMNPGKDDTFVLDFVNDTDDILKAFQPYYEATLLSETTDPNILYDLQRQVEEHHLFGDEELNAFAHIYFSDKGKQAQLRSILDPVVAEYEKLDPGERVTYRKSVNDFVRLYAFLSQILTFEDASLERFYQFVRHLLRKLTVGREELPLEITSNINMDAYKVRLASSGEIKLAREDGQLRPITDVGTAKPKEKETARLSELIQYINDNYGTDFTDEDKVRHMATDIQRRLTDRKNLIEAFNPSTNPSESARRLVFDRHFGQVVDQMYHANYDLYLKIKDDAKFADLFRRMVLEGFEDSLGHSTP
ncbi:MAG: DEAD/DEAH box helicase family protein [Chloroflexi bacterium]|nr:DEAD/DEAH box helicase family protein [Chloroflexota bacterium]